MLVQLAIQLLPLLRGQFGNVDDLEFCMAQESEPQGSFLLENTLFDLGNGLLAGPKRLSKRVDLLLEIFARGRIRCSF